MDSCVVEGQFYEKLESLKASKKGKASNLTVFVNDEFYDRAKAWLAAVDAKEIEGLSTNDVATIKRKKWTLQHGKIANQDGKYVVPKRDIFKTLSEAHSAIAHRGRDKTERYIRESFAEISQDVITLFVSLCKLHQQQRSVTDHVKKPVIKPIMADGFLKHVEIDLIDFRNLPCACNPSPSVLHSDNGKEFKSKNMSEFCNTHKIKQVHGAPRTPTTQGLVIIAQSKKI